MLIKLKLKYRSRKSFTGGKYIARTGNSHGPKVKRYPAGYQRTRHLRAMGW